MADPTAPTDRAPVFFVTDLEASLAYYEERTRTGRSVAPGSGRPSPPVPYGMRDFDVTDLDGNVLVFGGPAEQEP